MPACESSVHILILISGTTEKKFKSTTQSTIDVTISTGPKDYGETTIIPGRTVVSSSGKNKNNDVRNETTTPTTTKAASAEKLKGNGSELSP